MIELGKCSNCGTQIMDLTKKGKDKLLVNYRDHTLELSNQTLMRVAVCVNCKELLIDEKEMQAVADNIMQGHIDYWAKDIESPKEFQELSVVDANTSEEKFLDKINNLSE